jgi:hypothetical protein
MQQLNTPAVQRADALILEAQNRVADFERRHAETEQALCNADRQATEALLSEGTLDADAAIRLRGQMAVIERAIEAARARVPGLQVERKRVEAAEARRLAGEKLGEAERLEGDCRKWLKKLSEIQGVEYGLGVLASQRLGSWYPMQGEFGQAAEFLGLHEVKPDVTGCTVAMPKSRLLRSEATELRQQAASLEAEVQRAETPEPIPEAAEPVQLQGDPPERSILNPSLINEPRKSSFYRG